MSDSRSQDLVEQLVGVIRADFPEAPDSMPEDEFDRLCNNIARAISVALQKHEDRFHQLKPEFGEPQRPEG